MTHIAPLQRIVVVVPARDEAETLDACLGSIEAAAERIAPLEVEIVLVLDSCRDESASIAFAHPAVQVVHIDAGNVGVARRTGIAAALQERSGRGPLAYTWIATTDADSVVPLEWLRVHADAARRAADGVIGAVVPRLDDLDPALVVEWSRLHWPGATLGHVHGANLGIRASTYTEAGGFATTAIHEDVDLVTRLRARGADLFETEEAPVVTSARLTGRVVGGYADYLASLYALRPASTA